MKKLTLLIFALALVGGLFYFFNQPQPDETKTQSESEELIAPAVSPALSEDDSLTTIDAELSATELQDFDQEIQALDESINQL